MLTGLNAGDTLGNGRYRILAPLGSGSMGVVYRTRDEKFDREVALKTLHHLDANHLYRLKREFRSLAHILHPNLVQLYELTASDDHCFFTMELLEGVDPVTYSRATSINGGLSADGLDRIYRVFGQLVEGIRALHAAGQLHRDIKPSNAMVLRSGRAVVLDFGLAVPVALDSLATHPGSFAGTFDYMAPEQLWGRDCGEAADWYSLGVTLFEVLTGEFPFAGSVGEKLAARQSGPPTGPAAWIPGVPAEMDSLIRRLLDPEPDGRPGAPELLRFFEPSELPSAKRAATETPRPVGLFVGREGPLARLTSALEAAEAGEPQVIHVRGPSGMGKTELVRRFTSELRVEGGPLVLKGRCHPQESMPYKALDPLIDDLSRYLVQLPDEQTTVLAPRHAGALLRLFPVLGRVPALANWPTPAQASDPAELRRQGFAALRELLARIADRQVAVLWIDDAQWGDRDSASLLSELLRPPDAPRILLVLCYRSEDGGESALLKELARDDFSPNARQTVEDLAPLRPTETLALATQVVRDHGITGDVDFQGIVDESAGSPFFVAELAHYLSNQGEAPAALSVPRSSLADLVGARLRALTADHRELLELVAVAGGPVDLDLVVQTATTGAAARPMVYGLCSKSLLRASTAGETEKLETYHDRIREAVLTTLDSEGRRQRHGQLAHALEAQASPDFQALARHTMGSGEPLRAADYAVQAAEDAAKALAFERSASLYELALQWRGERDADWKLQAKRAEALAHAGREADAGQLYRDAADALERAAPDALRQAALRGRAAEGFFYGGRLAAGMQVLRGVLRDLRIPIPASPRAAMRTAMALRLRFLLRGFRVAPQPPDQIPAETLVRLDTLQGASRGTVMLDHSLADALAVRHLLGALESGEPSRALRALGLEAGFESNLGGRWLRRRSEKLLVEVERLAEYTGAPYDRGWLSLCRANCAWFRGEWSECVELGEQALWVFDTQCTGVQWEIDVQQAFVLSALAQMGRVRELSQRLPELLEDARRRKDLYALSVFRTGDSVMVPLAEDDPAGAVAVAESTLHNHVKDHFTSQHFHHLIATVQSDLYEGESWRAWGRIDRSWAALRSAGFLSLDCIGIQLRSLRGRAALAAAAGGAPPDELRRWSRARLLRTARRDARRIAASALRPAAPMAAALRAGLASAANRPEDESSALEAAMEGFARVDMALHRESARLQLGRTRGGCDGAALVEQARTWMNGEGITRPEVLAGVLVPGRNAD